MKNLLATLIAEHRAAVAASIKQREDNADAEVVKRERILRDGIHQLNVQGPLTAYEMAEMLDGCTTGITKSGWSYEVIVQCTNGFELCVSFHENPQRPGESTWGKPRIRYAVTDRMEHWFADRASVVQYIGTHIDTSTDVNGGA